MGDLRLQQHMSQGVCAKVQIGSVIPADFCFSDVIPNRAEGPVRNLLFFAGTLNDLSATRPPKTATAGAASD
jgi:hypothetical protein